MNPIRNFTRIAIPGLLFAFVFTAASCAQESPKQLRKQANQARGDGNYAEALKIYEKLSLDLENDPGWIGHDLGFAISCLKKLNRINEADALLEKVIARHKTNWRLLKSAAREYINLGSYGYLVAGKFQRGPHRGGGKYVNCTARDRVRAMQLMKEALQLIEKDHDDPEQKAHLAWLCSDFAKIIMHGIGYRNAWRLQTLTDLSRLPDYEEKQSYNFYAGQKGAPVDADNNPLFYYVPESFAAARSDGERLRWCWEQVIKSDSGYANGAKQDFAGFLYYHFGVHTLNRYGSAWSGLQPDIETGQRAGIFALHTLGEDETIARLATGVRRFHLPDEFNFIKMYKELAALDDEDLKKEALDTLAGIFENRRQFDRALEYWKLYRECKLNKHQSENANRHISQIIDNWGTFEPVATYPAGKGATVDYRFRNGKEVEFIAYQVKYEDLIADIKEYIKGDPREFEWQNIDPNNIGRRLVYENETKYLGAEAARWTLELKPRAKHFDRRIAVTTPLQKAGVYLLLAKIRDGNTSRIIIWVNDTVIVKKQLDEKTLYYVADAVTGAPLAKANLEFFGWERRRLKNGNRPRIATTDFAEYTDKNGQVILGEKDLPDDYRWLLTATTADGRRAWFGFNNVWYNDYYDQEYNQVKTLFITDRPVYRPEQTVKFKAWRRHAKYDQKDRSQFAGQAITVKLYDPRNEKILEKTFTADAYGGIQGEVNLPADAALGVYRFQIISGHFFDQLGGNTFRVEEYKKPEFEVSIKAPQKPVMLGEKVTATVEAKYYFGAPVGKAQVKYKVLRYPYAARWFPPMPWDWFYGPGYWWFGYDYKWYPGWQEWGCPRPFPWWRTPSAPPEVVLENAAPIGPDGKLTITIDTRLAKELHGDTDHRYEITAEVRDESRRTIVGTGTVLVARKPFSVQAWVNRGYYRVGDTVQAAFKAQTLDRKPVAGKGKLRLLRINYGTDMQPEETEVQAWELDPDSEGRASQQFHASRAGQYRISYTVTDSEGHAIEGGYLFVVRGEGFDGRQFRFDNIELVTDKREYAPGEEVKLMINTDRAGSTVLLFLRPVNSVYSVPRLIRMRGKSTVETIAITPKDMPNFFIEAMTIADGEIYTATREVVVPPQKRVLKVEVAPSAEKYKPGEKGRLKVKITDFYGKPYSGSAVVTVYDKAVEYISGGSNIPGIKEFYWKWRRRHYPRTESNLQRHFYNLLKKDEPAMGYLGLFGHLIADEENVKKRSRVMAFKSFNRSAAAAGEMMQDNIAMPAPMSEAGAMGRKKLAARLAGGKSPGQPETATPMLRKEFADTALWIAALETDADGFAEVVLPMPENLTTWKIEVWAMGQGTRVGEGSAEVITSKELLLRMQAPRFFIEKDEVVLSANIHNYLKNAKEVSAVLELDGPCLKLLGEATQKVKVESGGEARVDWRVAAIKEGEAVIRMRALTDEESDAMEMRFPVYVHGMDKLVPQCGVLRPEDKQAAIAIKVPEERRVNASRLEIRYSPSLAMAMVDALPYLVSYPYDCTEQTLNRFLPAVLTQKTLQRLGVSLKDIEKKRSNLNAQETGNDAERAKGWKRHAHNPVFSEREVGRMVKQGVKRLTAMQVADGGWGWFSGYGEKSYPHTTALVVHGLLLARENDVAIVPGVIKRGIEWLKQYQAESLAKIEDPEHPRGANNRDAFVYMVLAEAGEENAEMREFLYRDRNSLSVYSKAVYGLALHRQGHTEKLAMIMRNIEQYLVNDDENQTAYLNLPNGGYWWYWYGSEMEAHAAYLKLLAEIEPESKKAARLVKYMLNNRKHATWWNSTRDTALCIEAFADYLKASGEDKPDLRLALLYDGKVMKEVEINSDNLFTFDNKFVLTGDAVESGTHKIELRKQGKGPLYFNAYLSYFTLEDPITSAGLEVKVNRKVYKLNPVDKTAAVSGSRGQAVRQKVEKYERELLTNDSVLKSGDLVEVELIIESKNDYEYLIFEDMKAAGFEPVEVRSGYTGNEMGAYVEFRDEKVTFFVRRLARGRHSVSYRLRAEVPGRFSALPAKGYAMYAPELKGNSDEIKLIIED